MGILSFSGDFDWQNLQSYDAGLERRRLSTAATIMLR
jgi:hypothetical protein